MKNQFFDEYFYLKKSERQGVIVFFICSMLVIFSMRFITQQKVPVFIQSQKENRDPSELPIIDKKKKANKKSYSTNQKGSTIKEPSKKVFMFDPNTITKDSFQMLGFSGFASQNLDKFRKKGGKFHSISQLQKIYGMDSVLLQSLTDYISFGEHPGKN